MSIRGLLDKKFFPFVIKPGRYAGGELGQIAKDDDNRVKYLHTYPDKYEIGQSNVGLQILYHVINKDDRFLCERAFAVDTDAEELMRREKIPLFSLETSRPASEFDAIGFSLVDETVYTNVLAMIDLAGVPLRQIDRNDTHPLIIAGGPAVYNPEPLAPFVDVFFIGDAEEGLPELLGALHESRGASRSEKLEAICRRVESVYVPSFYDDQQRPLTDHLAVEIMRGCPQGCRFCMARQVYHPVRVRPGADIVEQVETQIKKTGYEEVCLLSLSSSDYPHVDDLAAPLSRSLEPQRVSISLPSQRPGGISSKLLDAVKRVRRFGLTIAPEAGTERLRLFLGKNIPDQAIYDTLGLAFEKGWSTVKLYFMVGLPSETEEDLLGIVGLCRKIHEISGESSGKKTINVTLSPFVPKPHTPFQWDEAVDEAETFRRIGFVKSKLRLSHTNVKHNSTQLAQVVAMIGRGNRRMADVLESVYRKGCRFDGWSESFQYDKWLASFEENGLKPTDLLKAIPFSANLPWSHIDKGISSEKLHEERQRTSAKLRQYTPVSAVQREPEPAMDNQMMFGRSKKKVAARNVIAPTKNRVRIKWGKTGRLRYLSHLDNIRMLEMALRRARIPVQYSQGYNPAPRLSFGPPLPLGFTSECEYVDITLETNLMPHMIDSLGKAIPEGMDILEARAVLGKRPSLSSSLNRVAYRILLDVWDDPGKLREAVEDLQTREVLECRRTRKEETKVVDIRPAVYDVLIVDNELEMVLGLGDGGYARPTEAAEFLTAGMNTDIVALPFHRREMYRLNESGEKIDGMDL
jgi:radical SAM-linked protein